MVRLETRPPNLEGEGEIKMRDLVKNCLRMRPERIIVGEVRGPEAFDLLQAMNTGHDGSMGTLHSNSPREAISRLESMIMMGGYQLPVRTIREMIAGSIDVIVQVARLRDGSRKVTHITEVLGMEGDVVTLQNLIVYDITGEDANGRLLGRHRSTGIARPRFWDRAHYYQRGGPARRGAGRGRGPRRKRQPARRQECLRRTLCHLPRPCWPRWPSGRWPTPSCSRTSPAIAQKDSRLKELTEPKGREVAERARAGGVAAQVGHRHAEGHGEPAESGGEGLAQPAAGAGRPRHHAAGLSGWQASFAGVLLALLVTMCAAAAGATRMLLSLIVGLIGVFGVPRWFVNKLAVRRQTKFTARAAPTPSTSSCAA